MHLKNYEEAKTPLEKAIAALFVSEKKNSKAAAWNWAEEAAEISTELGVNNAQDLLGDGRYPDIQPLLEKLKLLEMVREDEAEAERMAASALGPTRPRA